MFKRNIFTTGPRCSWPLPAIRLYLGVFDKIRKESEERNGIRNADADAKELRNRTPALRSPKSRIGCKKWRYTDPP